MAELVAPAVERVELFEDRATVTRRVALPAAPGRQVLTVGPLSPLIRATDLSVLLDGDGIVESVQVERLWLPRDRTDDDAHRELRGKIAAWTDRRARQDVAWVDVEGAALRAGLARDVVEDWAPEALATLPDVDGWLREARARFERAREAQAREASSEAESELIDREVALLRERLGRDADLERVLRAVVRVAVVAPAGGALRLRTTIPCAAWRPRHTARWVGDRLTVEVGAAIWNHTGEDWIGATVSCSTARPGARAAAPVLTDDVVRVTKRAKEVVVEARDVEVKAARDGRVSDALPGVDDGGHVRVFPVADPLTVPDGAEPVLVTLESWESPATVANVVAAEEFAGVIRVVSARHGGTRPLLAGPVELFGERAALGRTAIGLVAPGEPFSLGFGTHEDLVVARTESRERKEARLLGKPSVHTKAEIRVTHLGGQPVDVVVRERVPVSEIVEVKVLDVDATPKLSDGPDADGLCSWTRTLKPGESVLFTLKWGVEAPPEVTLPW